MSQIILFLTVLTAVRLACADETAPTQDLMAKAAQADTAAQLSLAYRFRDGRGVKTDYAEAMRWAHLAAIGGLTITVDFPREFCRGPAIVIAQP